VSEPVGSPAAGSSEREAARGRWLVLAAAAFWGTSATLARFAFRDRQVPPLTAVELRLAIAVALLAPWLAWRRPESLRVRREDWGYFLVLGLCGMAAVQGTYYYAIATIGVGLAILIQYLAPSLIVAWEVLRGARVSAATAIGVASALAGTALLVGHPDPGSLHARAPQATPLGWAAGFGSTIAFAFYVVFSKRGLRRYRPETVLLYTFLVAGAFWAIVTPPWRIVAAGYPADIWLIFVGLGVFSTLVPFSLFNAGLRRVPAARAGIYASFEPVVAVVSASVFLREGLSAVQWLGALLVLLAAALASRQSPETVRAQAERG
jgi:drug/metabolite transporter (DMT)-like permease